MSRTDFGTLWEKVRVGCSERTALKRVYYQGWNRSPAQVGCMRQVLGAGALGRPRGMGWGGRREGGSGCGTHVKPWLIHVHVWQKPLQYCKVISLQLIKINGKKKKRRGLLGWVPRRGWWSGALVILTTPAKHRISRRNHATSGFSLVTETVGAANDFIEELFQGLVSAFFDPGCWCSQLFSGSPEAAENKRKLGE